MMSKRKRTTQQVNPPASPDRSHFSDAPAAGRCHPALACNLNRDLLSGATASDVYGVTNLSRRCREDAALLEDQGQYCFSNFVKNDKCGRAI